MDSVSTLGKFLDQPILVSKFSKSVPLILASGAAVYGLYDAQKQKNKDAQAKTYIKNICVLGFTVASALIATKGMKPLKFFGKQIFKGFSGLSGVKTVKEIKQIQTELVDSFVKSNKVDEKTSKILRKAKDNVLKFSEIKHLYNNLSKSESGNSFLQKFTPEPKNLSSKDIFGEIGRLSLMGLIPIVGGISGGILGDRLTEKDWKNHIPDKIKEGSYQYLANIFLCNIGAGAALGFMEKFKVKSKAAKAGAMISGIILTGVVGGSSIANYISKNCINSLFSKKSSKPDKFCSERTPEALDIFLHADDAATVAVMSGLRWIEPALPVLYSVSGYRAGIGYRNGEKYHLKQKHNKQKQFKVLKKNKKVVS